jgi:hypothetical protein
MTISPASRGAQCSPSIPKAYCSHCQRTARGTSQNPRFSVKEGHFDGVPVIEVLKDGGSIHMWDSHFRFGQRKAEMLIACVELLRDFWMSNGDEGNVFLSQVVENRRRGLRVRIHVEKHPDFERSDGEMVERSWLRLQALPPDNEHMGLGVMKCRAICEVQEDLRKWLRKTGVLD